MLRAISRISKFTAEDNHLRSINRLETLKINAGKMDVDSNQTNAVALQPNNYTTAQVTIR